MLWQAILDPQRHTPSGRQVAAAANLLAGHGSTKSARWPT